MIVKNSKLKDFRISKGLTKEQMAEKLGYTLSMYEKVEANRAGTSSKFMSKFKEVFPEEKIDDIFFAE